MRISIDHFLKKQQESLLLRERFILKNSIDFASNDYLGLSRHPEVIEAFKGAADLYGLGSGGSVFISGYKRPHQEAEEKFAEFVQREKALLFPSGYHANLGVINALSGRNSQLVIDRLSHASIIDAAIMSRADFKRYPHNNINAIKEKIKPGAVICTEGVFSMEGSISDLKSVVKISNNNKATFVLDDAHALGVIGRRGSIDFHGLANEDVHVLVNPLGKAIGIMGAFVSGSNDYIKYIEQRARSYKYTTSLPPAIASAISKSVEMLQKETWRQEKLTAITQFFIQEAQKREMILTSFDITPIKSIIVPSMTNLIKIQESLLKKGMFVPAIRNPTVPMNSPRLRISLNVGHTEEEIVRLLDILTKEIKSSEYSEAEVASLLDNVKDTITACKP